MQIAVYGKGGIGKSTISANLTAALAVCNSKVLQIGCDPKHDSTRLLHHGQKITTILDYLLNTPEDEQNLADVLIPGFLDTGCIEAGGPRPGMGCAGRGILTAFDFLNKYHAIEKYDQVIYDVLGDVVCGGFAVPVRKQYADAVVLVTSGESMSIYAANNILCGIKNLNPQGRQIAGIIYNSRGVGDDRKYVEDFTNAVNLPILAEIPRSNLFTQAEKEAMTLVEKSPKSAANSPDPADPIDVLSKVGGFDIAAMCGFYLGAAASKAPALLDGVISCAAALCAARLCPNALGYLVGTHASSEPASRELLRELGIKAPLDAGMHLGEGAGAMAYLPLLDSALRVYRDGKTFTATGMAAYEHFEAGK